MAKRRSRLTPAEQAEAERQKSARKAYVESLVAKGLSVKRDAAWNIMAIHRHDAFSLLHERKSLSDLQLHSIRRLEVLIGLANGWERPEQTLDRVSRTSEGAPGQNITQAMIDASKALEFIMAQVGRPMARLLDALVGPTADKAALPLNWRATVERVTGERDPRVHVAAIRMAGDGLSEAWRAWDYRERERKKRAA